MEEKIQTIIVPAILEHEAISTSCDSNPASRPRTGSIAHQNSTGSISPVDPQKALDQLLRQLEEYSQILKTYGVDPDIGEQIFRQVRFISLVVIVTDFQ